MTAKRFTTDYKDFLKEDMSFIKNNDKRMTFQEIVDLLNKQHETIERLKDNCKVLDEVKCEIAEENEQLKHRLAISEKANFVTALEKENEKLKQSMQEVYQYFVDYLNELREDIDYEQYNEVWNNLQKINNNENEDSMFIGCDAEHYQRGIKEIKPYVDDNDCNYTDDFIIKLALSYTLQSLRNGESLKRFQWDYNKLNRRNNMSERFMVDDCGTLIDMETRDMYDYVSEVMGLLNNYDKENKELKLQMQRLYNYFVDWHRNIMGANQFSEMWDNVKEDEEWD